MNIPKEDTLLAVAASLGFSPAALKSIAAAARADGWVPLSQAARQLRLSRRTLHRWCAAGRLPKRPYPGRRGSLVPFAAAAALASSGGQEANA